MNYYERHIGDYLKDTAHLSLLEHGVYSRLMDVYYTRESALPEAEVARLIGARSKEEKSAMNAVLAEFFVLIDGAFSQKRCEEEIDNFHESQVGNEDKKVNDKERQRRARERRKGLFEELRSHGVVPPFNTKTAELQSLLSRVTGRDASDVVTLPVTRDNTATHTPDTSNHTQEENVADATAGKTAKPKLTDPQEIIFGYGVPLLVNAGSTDKAARSFLGGLRKAHGDTELVNKLRDCIREQPLQPLEWLAKALPPKRAVPPPEAEAARRADVDAETKRLLGFKSSEVIDG